MDDIGGSIQASHHVFRVCEVINQLPLLSLLLDKASAPWDRNEPVKPYTSWKVCKQHVGNRGHGTCRRDHTNTIESAPHGAENALPCLRMWHVPPIYSVQTSLAHKVFQVPMFPSCPYFGMLYVHTAAHIWPEHTLTLGVRFRWLTEGLASVHGVP